MDAFWRQVIKTLSDADRTSEKLRECIEISPDGTLSIKEGA